MAKKKELVEIRINSEIVAENTALRRVAKDRADEANKALKENATLRDINDKFADEIVELVERFENEHRFRMIEESNRATLRTRLDAARGLLGFVLQEAINFDEINKSGKIGNPGLRGLLIEPGDVIHTRIRTWLAEDGEG